MTRFPFLIRLVLLLALPVCSDAAVPEGSAPFYQGPGTRGMAERLERIGKESNPANHPFMNRERAEIFKAMLDRGLASPEASRQLPRLLDLQSKYAIELLNAGLSEAAVVEFNRFGSLLKENQMLGPQNRTLLRHYLALAHLRLGEQQNCVLNHTADSCLFPIRPAGFHKLPQASRAALTPLMEQLEEFPDDLRARWLLNIAHMTLGEYPDKVPPAQLIPPKAFASDYPLPFFPDVAGRAGLDFDTLAGGIIADDFNGDGYLDLVISAWGLRDQIRFLINNKDGTFTDRTRESGLLGELGGLNLIQADYNNDGHLDFLILRGAWFGREGHHPNSLIRNNGNGTFDDVTEEAGLLTFRPTQAGVWFDFNNDGWIDLFIGNETTPGDTNPCELFRNNGDGTFTECAAASGIDKLGYIKAVAAGDFDNDGRSDLYLSCRGEPNALYRNAGPAGAAKDPKAPWRFVEVAQAAGVTEPAHSFPAWFFDYDNDGWPDLFAAGFRIKNVGEVAADALGLPHNAQRSKLYRNQRDGTFRDVSAEAGLDRVVVAMSGNFGDLDNDGYLDFYLGTGDPDLSTLVANRMFRNDGAGKFQDVTTRGGFGHLQKGHGIAFADLDNDGDQDVYAVIGGAYQGDNYRNALFENPGSSNRWITVKLEGTRSNRSALGARLRLEVQTPAGPRVIYKTVSSGGSFGASPLRQEIGLGQAEKILKLSVRWPGQTEEQTVTGAQPNRFYQIREGTGEAREMSIKSYRLGGANPIPAHHTR